MQKCCFCDMTKHWDVICYFPYWPVLLTTPPQKAIHLSFLQSIFEWTAGIYTIKQLRWIHSSLHSLLEPAVQSNKHRASNKKVALTVFYDDPCLASTFTNILWKKLNANYSQQRRLTSTPSFLYINPIFPLLALHNHSKLSISCFLYIPFSLSKVDCLYFRWKWVAW